MYSWIFEVCKVNWVIVLLCLASKGSFITISHKRKKRENTNSILLLNAKFCASIFEKSWFNVKNAKNWHTRCASWWNDFNIEHTLNTLWTHSEHTLNTLWTHSEHTLKICPRFDKISLHCWVTRWRWKKNTRWAMVVVLTFQQSGSPLVHQDLCVYSSLTLVTSTKIPRSHHECVQVGHVSLREVFSRL